MSNAAIVPKPRWIACRFSTIPVRTPWRKLTLFSVRQVDLMKSLNHSMLWDLFPAVFAVLGRHLEKIRLLTALYPGV